MMRSKKMARFCCVLFLIALFCPAVIALGQGENNPTGVTGVHNGNITTGCSYDPYTLNATREVTDIVVAGTVGAYPLKLSRYFNSRWSNNKGQTTGGWTFSYVDYGLNSYSSGQGVHTLYFPDGRHIDLFTAVGVPETLTTALDRSGIARTAILLADGGKVLFEYYTYSVSGVTSTESRPIEIIDPYGLRTVYLYRNPSFRVCNNEYDPNDCHYEPNTSIKILDKVVEPGGRYLQFDWDRYDVRSVATARDRLTRVRAYDHIDVASYDPVNPTTPGNLIETVNYDYDDWQNPPSGPVYGILNEVDYDDGTKAQYTYPLQNNSFNKPVVLTAKDVRYAGPMRNIEYDYARPNGKVNGEKVLAGSSVSSVQQAGVYLPSGNFVSRAIETRGDGPTRSFYYNPVPPNQYNAGPLDGKLIAYSDFLGNFTNIGYDLNGGPRLGFISSVTDPNNHTTTYERQSNSWGITKITHPDGSFMTQTYYEAGAANADNYDSPNIPFFLRTRTDENGNTTRYHRDSKNRITAKDYPDGAHEEFTYNNFDQVLSHLMTNGATESFTYDARGLKQSWTDGEGKVTNYDYYTSGPWTDRVNTVTYPPNASGFRATETFEYDRKIVSGASTGIACGGRGAVTRTTHTDMSSVTNVYNQFGDLLTTTDELNHIAVTNTYDDYGRLLTTATPPQFIGDTQNHTTTYTYGGLTNSYITTSKLPFQTILPSGKKSYFHYDQNWRKWWDQQAPGTSEEASSYFFYDQFGSSTSIGNMLAMQDPRGYVTKYHYDARDRQDQVTDALNHTTTFTFWPAGQKRTETYANGQVVDYHTLDGMNRVTYKTVKRDAATTDETWMTYDFAGNLKSNKDENGNTYKYEYDLVNRRTKMIYPHPDRNDDYEQTQYDDAGNVKTFRNRSCAVQTFSYDDRNRQTGFSWNDGPAGGMALNTSPQTTVYDPASRKTRIENDDAIILFAYYDDNKLKTQEEWVKSLVDGSHRVVTYTYDSDGNRKTIGYPSGKSFGYDYTGRNQLKAVKDEIGNTIASYTFDPNGNNLTKALENGTSSSYLYDEVNRAISIQHQFVNGGLLSVVGLAPNARRFDYVYNEVNDILSVKRDFSKGDGFEYDLTRQITKFHREGTVSPNGSVESSLQDTNMKFDGCGNRIEMNGTSHEYNALNQSKDTGTGYDTNGNLKDRNGWKYVYDAQNRLRRAIGPAATTNFYYDGLNRQVLRTVANNLPLPTPTPSPVPTVSPLPTVSPVPTASPTPSSTVVPFPTSTPLPSAPPGIIPSPTPWPSPTATASPGSTVPPPTPTPVQKCADVTFSTSLNTTTHIVTVSMNTTTPTPVTIFYTVCTVEDCVPANPTHSGSTPTGGTLLYTSATKPTVPRPGWRGYKAVAYKSGYTDSDITGFSVENYQDFGFANGANSSSVTGTSTTTSGSGAGVTTPVVVPQQIVESVWDGDWAILEEFTTPTVVQSYVHGLHGLIKNVQSAVYYYQDGLGSTTQIANAAGCLLETYTYDLYGKPTIISQAGSIIAATLWGVHDLFAGARWMDELGLYDMRNRFMSPEMGVFLQTDPIGFKGDASNLYRYVGNDWANKTDPMGTQAAPLPAEMRNPDPTYQYGAGGAWNVMQNMRAIVVAQVTARNAEPSGSKQKESSPENDSGPVTATSKGYKEFPKWGKGGAGEDGALDDYTNVKRSGFKTGYGGYIAQRDHAKDGGYIAVPGRAETLKYNEATKQNMQTLDLRPADIPQGYHAIGVHYAHARHDDFIPQQVDQGNLSAARAKAVLATPPYKGSNPEAAPRLHYYPESD